MRFKGGREGEEVLKKAKKNKKRENLRNQKKDLGILIYILS